MNILYDFSSALLQARQRKDATQEQIAFALDISQATYNAWECGHRICPYKHIIALICYFEKTNLPPTIRDSSACLQTRAQSGSRRCNTSKQLSKKRNEQGQNHSHTPNGLS